jgi:hypothetical protein
MRLFYSFIDSRWLFVIEKVDKGYAFHRPSLLAGKQCLVHLMVFLSVFSSPFSTIRNYSRHCGLGF